MLSQDSSDNESLKLLSQETYQQLCAQLGAEDCRPVIDDPTVFMEPLDRLPGREDLIDQLQPVDQLPTLVEFPGEYGFNIEVGKQPKLAKSTGWCYSPELNRLYVQLHKHCQLAFTLTACGGGAPDALATAAARLCALGSQPLFIRATPVFNNYLQVPVERCPNHVIDDADLDNRRHFVLASHPAVAYFSDASRRHTTVVPFQFESDILREKDSGDGVVPGGSCRRSAWYGYSFKCLSTCTRSINRRTVSIIFALESSDGAVLGRRVIEVKVCSCPGRDMIHDRKSSEGGSTPSASHPHSRAINYPASLMNGPRKLRRFKQSASDLASTMQSRSSHNPSKKLAARLQVPARNKPSCLSAAVTAFVKPSPVSSESLEKTANNDTSKIVNQSAADNDLYCVQVRTRKNYKILKTLSSFMPSGGICPKAVVADDMKGYSNAVSTDSVHSDSDSKYSSSIQSLPCSAQLSNCSPGNTQENAHGIEHVSKACDHSGRPSIQEWLDLLGLAPYTDDFARAGFRTMADLQDSRRFSAKDLGKLQIGAAHSAIIWKSLKQWRLQV